METNRTNLRQFIESDFESLKDMMTSPEVMQFTGFKKALSIDIIKEKLSLWIIDQNIYAAIDKKSDEFVGWFMLKKTFHQYPEIGFMLSQNFWSKGYATEIANKLINYAQSKLKVDGVVATVTHGNLASIKVLQRIGMSETSELKDKSRDSDLLYFLIKFI